MNNIIKRVWNQNRMVTIEDLRGMAFQAESGGHTFEISGINDANEAVSLSGTVAGVFMRPDGTDVALTGTASDGVVSVTLSDACYAVAGRFGLTIFVTADSKKTCVYACIGTVAQTSYGTVAGDTPQDVVDLINAINAAIASIPADYTDLLDSIAPSFSDSTAYASGTIVWYNGVLYQFTADKAAGSWDATKVSQISVSTAKFGTDNLAGASVTTPKIADSAVTLAKLNSEVIKSSINLFNPNDPDFVANEKLNNDGTTTASTGKFVSGFIPLRAGQTVCVNYPTGIYGSSSSLVLYNANKQRTGYVNPSRYTDSRGNGYLRYNVPADTSNAFFRATGNMSGTGTYMYVYAAEMPSTYEPYADDVTLASGIKVPYANIQDVAVAKTDTDFVKINPININDLSSMVVGVIKNSRSNGDLDSTVTNYRSTDYIPVEEGETYKLSIYGGVYYGSGFLGIAYYDSYKSYKGHIVPTGGISTTATVDTITIPTGAAFIRVSYPAARVTNPKLWYTTQIFKGNVWTQMYLPYDGEYRLQNIGLTPEYSAAYNCLYGKKAMWNGDSICAADNDAQGGWAFRIGAANGMYAKNYAVSGGTIAENTGTNVHSVSSTLDGMITDFPDADYIIIEGGTNDADILGAAGLGTFDADDFSGAYIDALDNDTFSGALESIFYRLVTQMKGKHIGYIIPQKMGHTEVLVARRRTYFDRAIAIAQKWGIPVLDLWDDLYFNWRLAAHWDQTMTSAQNEAAGNLYLDGQHLTTTGYSVQSPIIAEWMKKI